MGDLGYEAFGDWETAEMNDDVRDWETSGMRTSEIGRVRICGIRSLGDLGDEEFGDWETSEMRRSEIGILRA